MAAISVRARSESIETLNESALDTIPSAETYEETVHRLARAMLETPLTADEQALLDSFRSESPEPV